MKILEKLLSYLAISQKRYGYIILGLFVIFSLFIATGINDVKFESDFSELMPQDLPIVKLNQKIKDKFGGQDTTFILLMLDDSLESKGTPVDIREPEIMEYVLKLDEALAGEPSLESVVSVAPAIEYAKAVYPELSVDAMKQVMDANPGLSELISDDFKKTIIIISSDVGGGEERVASLTQLIEDKLSAYSIPAGVSARITGSPSIMVAIINLLKSDAVYTLAVASIIVLFLLFFIQRSIVRSLVIFTPILLGVVWTIGTLGHLGVKINVATAGLGAMIIGLGVEYGVFMITRYYEERDQGKDQLESLKIAVPGVGSAIIGSGSTTVIGFMALTLSVMPMLQILGFSLALGIFYSFIAAVFVEPIIIIYIEKAYYLLSKRTFNSLSRNFNCVKDDKKKGDRR